MVSMYLFIGTDGQELDKSINHQLSKSELWHKLTTQNNNNTITSNTLGVDTGNAAQEKTSNIKFMMSLDRLQQTVRICIHGQVSFLFQNVLPCEVKVLRQ